MTATTNHDIYNYPRRLEKHKEAIATMKNGLLALNFLDHLLVQGLSTARVSKYAAHLRTILRIINFQSGNASKQDIEKVVAWIQSRNYAEWTKHDLKLILRKLIQFAKTGNCNINTPMPLEAAWIPFNVKRQESVTAEDILTLEEVERILKHASNAKALNLL